MNPIIKPKRGPPKEVLMNPTTVYPSPFSYPTAKPKKIFKKTIAVPSFNKLSPSTKVLNLTLAPNSFKRETTATGSVAERTAPKTIAWYQFMSSSEYPRINLKDAPIIIDPKSTPGPAKVMIFHKDFLKTCHAQL